MPRAWLIDALPKMATAQFFLPPPLASEQDSGSPNPFRNADEAKYFSYGLIALDGRHYLSPGTTTQAKFTAAKAGWRSIPRKNRHDHYDLQLGVDLARWRPLRSHGPGEYELPLSPTQRSPIWAIDRLRLGIPLQGNFRVAFTDPKPNKGFIRSPLGWPAPGWQPLPSPMIALEMGREEIGAYQGRIWVGQGIGDAVNILEGGIAISGYIFPGIIGYSRGTMMESKPDRAARQKKSMVRSNWQAGIASDGRWPLAYGLYFGLGYGGGSGYTDRPLSATEAGRCYQCYAEYQRYKRNILMAYASYFILARYFVHFEVQDLDQQLGKSETTDHFSYQAIGTLLKGGSFGYISLGLYRGHRELYPAAAPDALEPARPSYVLRWGFGQVGGFR